jgi:hypothetical protein
MSHAPYTINGHFRVMEQGEMINHNLATDGHLQGGYPTTQATTSLEGFDEELPGIRVDAYLGGTL